MCVSPIHIKNKSLDRRVMVDRLYNYVPCGHCVECDGSRQNGYFTRAFYHWKDITAKGGVTYYYTLTYDEKHVPRWKGVTVFSKHDVKKWLKDMTYWMPCEFDYFLVGEYGTDDRYTHRPHYHVLIYCKHNITFEQINDVVSRTWFYGRVEEGRFNHGVVTDVRAIKYCAKYVTKDMSISELLIKKGLTKEDIDEFILSQKESSRSLSLYNFHYQSVGFGECICDFVSTSDLVRGYFVRPDINGLTQRYLIPLYIYRKKCYKTFVNCNGNVCYRLNAYGIRIKYLKLKKQLAEQTQLFDILLKKAEQYFDKSEIAVRKFIRFDNFIKLWNLTVHNSERLAKYKLLYRDLPFIDWDFDDWSKDCELYKNSLEIYLNHDGDFPWHDDSKWQNVWWVFNGYDDFIQVLYSFVKFIRYPAYVERTKNYNSLQRYRAVTSRKLHLSPLLTLNQYSNTKFFHPYVKLCSKTFKSDNESYERWSLDDIKSHVRW